MVSVVHLTEGQYARFLLLDAKEEQIECGTIIIMERETNELQQNNDSREFGRYTGAKTHTKRESGGNL